jgi:hypothetical protein
MNRKLTTENAAATLALIGVSLSWSDEFEAYRVAPVGAHEWHAEYIPDLPSAYAEGLELADLIAATAASYARAFHAPATAARAAALATFR